MDSHTPVERAVVDYALAHPDAGAGTIAAALAGEWRLSKGAVHRILVRHGLETAAKRRAAAQARGSTAAAAGPTTVATYGPGAAQVTDVPAGSHATPPAPRSAAAEPTDGDFPTAQAGASAAGEPERTVGDGGGPASVFAELALDRRWRLREGGMRAVRAAPPSMPEDPLARPTTVPAPEARRPGADGGAMATGAAATSSEERGAMPPTPSAAAGAIAGAARSLADALGRRRGSAVFPRHAPVAARRAGQDAGAGVPSAAQGASGETDALTGLPRRAAAERRLAELLADAGTSGVPLAVAFIDLDGFKRVNDTRGHAEGDRVLRLAAQAMASAVRAGDLLARWGGDEFLLVMPGADMAAAESAVARLRAAAAGVAELSAGVAVLRPGDTIDSLVARADRAMYADKARRKYARGDAAAVPAIPIGSGQGDVAAFIGALPRAGTTTALCAWALIQAEAGRDVALVDANPANPALAAVLWGQAADAGWEGVRTPRARLALFAQRDVPGSARLRVAPLGWRPAALPMAAADVAGALSDLLVAARLSGADAVAFDLGSFPPLSDGKPDPRLRWAAAEASLVALVVPHDLLGVDAAARWTAALRSEGAKRVVWLLADYLPELGAPDDVRAALDDPQGVDAVVVVPWDPVGVRAALGREAPPVRLALPVELTV